MRHVPILCSLVLLAWVQPAVAAETLEPDAAVTGTILTQAHAEPIRYRTYVLDVPQDVVAVEFELEAPYDLDLYVGLSDMADYDSDAWVSALGETGEERILLTRDNIPGLESRRYWIDVSYGREDAPLTAGGAWVEEIPYRLEARFHRRRVDERLDAGTLVSSAVAPRKGPYRTYVIDVPANTPVLRVDLASDAADLDLRLRFGEGMNGSAEADLIAEGLSGFDTLHVRPTSGRAIRPGRYYVDVYDPVWLDWASPFRIAASFIDEPPKELLALPTFPARTTSLGRAVASCVELLDAEGGGSGVLISEAGFILTNHHVVAAWLEKGTDEVGPLMVSITVDPKDAPRAAFRGHVAAYDKALDLALVRVTSGVYGQPLPPNYRFPAAVLGDARALGLTDRLFCLGYPMAGGLGSRVPLTVSAGIVSGFERRGDELHIKTDADIHAGFSGGAVVNEKHELVALATETIREEGGVGQVGYVRPLWLVPEGWWKLAGVER